MRKAPVHKRVFAEWKRCRVFRVTAMYGALAFAAVEAADPVFPGLALLELAFALVVWLSLVGFPVVRLLAWAFDLTPDGLATGAVGPGGGSG